MHSDHILFVDESGDHGLASIDRHYPVFVLCSVLVRRDHYLELSSRLSSVKMEIWGHDEVVLHEHDVRKPSGIFSILQQQDVRNRLHEGLNAIFTDCTFQLIYSVIKKADYVARYQDPINPYDLSMSFVLERAYLELNSRGRGAQKTTVVVECRGKVEDAQLRRAFDRIVAGNNACGRALPFELLMVSKLANSPGLQVADLAARPMGRKVIGPDQPNRAYEVLRNKIRRDVHGRAEGWGVKIAP